MFNIPNKITQGDKLEWWEELDDYSPATDNLKCFIRGATKLDLEGVANGDLWDFTITSAQSAALTPGAYKTQFKIIAFSGENKTLGSTDLLVCQSFESLTELDTRNDDEKELSLITQAIAKLASGAVAEYQIGDRRMRYQDLGELTERQAYLRTRIAIASGRIKPGGRNVGVRFGS